MYPVRIKENTDQTKLRIWTLFTQYSVLIFDFRQKLRIIGLLLVCTSKIDDIIWILKIRDSYFELLKDDLMNVKPLDLFSNQIIPNIRGF